MAPNTKGMPHNPNVTVQRVYHFVETCTLLTSFVEPGNNKAYFELLNQKKTTQIRIAPFVDFLHIAYSNPMSDSVYIVCFIRSIPPNGFEALPLKQNPPPSRTETRYHEENSAHSSPYASISRYSQQQSKSPTRHSRQFTAV